MTLDKFLRIVCIYVGLGVLLGLSFSCNSKEEEPDLPVVLTSANVAVSSFNLAANANVMKDLDSVFFSLDLERGLIYNADSLPKGTDVSHLIATINFSSNVTKANLVFNNTKTSNDTTVDYLNNSTDSIDFTYPVKLEVTAADEITSFTYTIKVNVHKQEPDSLMWTELAHTALPSRMAAPVDQKTIYHNNKAYCLIEENNGSYTLAVTESLNENDWTKDELIIDFLPLIYTFCSSQTKFWILSNDGILYTSNDGLNWESTEEIWQNIVGGYKDGILGIKDNGNELLHVAYPSTLDIAETELEPGFPVSGFSPLALIETEWYPNPMVFCVGGIDNDGNYVSSVWAFDGSNWATINSTELPALDSPMMCRYVVYRETPYVFKYREFDAWILMGGKFEDGTFNRTVYISMDNGIRWSVAPKLMQLPEEFPDLNGANMITAGYELTANLADAWESIETRNPGRHFKSSFTLDGYDITWICPYLYVFGGFNEQDILSDSIWRGVLTRLTFTPLF